MLHITKKHNSPHRKAIMAEIIISAGLFAAFIAPATQAGDITADTVIKLVNEARQGANVLAVKKNQILTEAAQRKADDMIENSYFAHTSPEGKSPWYWIDKSGYNYKFAGENLAINFANAEDQQEAWMDSPLHRKNILNENYNEIGVAVKEGVINGKNTIVTVQLFGAPTKAAADLATGKTGEVAPSKSAEGEVKTGTLAAGSVLGMFEEMGNHRSALLAWLTAFSLALLFAFFEMVNFVQGRHRKQSAYAVHITRR